MSGRITRSRRTALTALALTAIAGLTISGLPQGNAAPTPRQGSEGDQASTASSQHERKGNFDARVGSLKSQLKAARDTVSDQSKAFNVLTKQVGSQGIIDIDPATGTPSNLGRLDGFLSGPSSAKATDIALGYVRANAAGLGLTSSDLKTFSLRQDYVDIAGIHHISWTQSVDGITVFGNGLKANVTKTGELISIQGSPVSGLAHLARTVGTSGTLSAEDARSAAATDVGGDAADSTATVSKAGTVTTWANNDQAQKVWFVAASGLRLGWSTYVQAGGDNLSYQHVIDATSGSVLYRHDTVDNDKGDALVFDNYPGAAIGGTQRVFNLIDNGMLAKNATDLSGRFTVAWADLNDNNAPDVGETVPVPGSNGPGTPQYALTRFNNASSLCSKKFICTWNQNEPRSWATNKRADVTQGFYYNSLFHNYLGQAPFGFTPQAGNFQTNGGDPVLLNALDGANTDGGLPDANHINNANMSTPPDGVPPTMQMYLFRAPGSPDADGEYIPTSSSFDPSVLFHEYTHGLSNRLVIDATGNSTLNSVQAGSMGEAWSDYYAMDNLVTRDLLPDTSASGEVFEGSYLLADKVPFRTMAIDCAVGSDAPGCVAPVVADNGGYTYGDFPLIGGSPEVHSSGEVWAQTLWDLRKKFGHDVAGMLITRAMSLSADDPSMLDERNAILQADLAVYGGGHNAKLWRVFANRGMGFFAGTLGAADAFPAEDFSRPPAPEAPRSTVSGQVVDGITGGPVVNALVTITGHDSGYVGDYSAVTDGSGRYSISNVFVGTYPLVAVFAPGYEVLTQPLDVVAGGTTADFAPRRDWAASSGGGSVTDFNGPDFTDFGCGPAAAIDLSQGSGWGSTTGDDAGTPTNVMIPKFIVVTLPTTITLDSFGVNPSNTCGDPGSSSTGDYRIETSPNGTTWTTAAEGTFTSANRGMLNDVSVAAPVPDVQYIRFTMLSPQVPDFATNCPLGAYGGCTFTDMSELEVFGTEQ